MLNYAEELILLAIDDETGAFHRVTMTNLQLALIGALLMDLGLRKRIDAENERFWIISSEPTGDPFLDQILGQLGEVGKSFDTGCVIRQLYAELPNLKERLLESLEHKGIIRYSESRFLWLFKQRRYPVLDNSEEVEVLTRIKQIVLEDKTPEPRDIAMISLLYTCDLMDKIFTNEQLARSQSRIDELQNLDVIGHAVNRIIGEVQAMISSAFLT